MIKIKVISCEAMGRLSVFHVGWLFLGTAPQHSSGQLRHTVSAKTRAKRSATTWPVVRYNCPLWAPVGQSSLLTYIRIPALAYFIISIISLSDFSAMLPINY